MIVLRILLHGLIALVPMPHSSRMAALAIDVVNPAVQQKCTAPHVPTLTFTPLQGPCPAGCHPSGQSGQSCSCTLPAGSLQVVGFEATAAPMLSEPRREPPDSLPEDEQHAAEFSFLFNLDNINYKLLKTALNDDPGNLVARMVFPYTRLTACDLAIDPATLGGYEPEVPVHSFNFHPEGSAMGGRSQPVAQGLVAEADVSGSVSLLLAKYGDQGVVKIPLQSSTCAGDKTCVEVSLMNDREKPLKPEDPCNNPGRDFAYFYELATLPLPWAQRPIPHLETRQTSHAEKDLQPVACGNLMSGTFHPKGFYTHPVCAMAMFYPYQ
jgi:hypothetical protein